MNASAASWRRSPDGTWTRGSPEPAPSAETGQARPSSMEIPVEAPQAERVGAHGGGGWVHSNPVMTAAVPTAQPTRHDDRGEELTLVELRNSIAEAERLRHADLRAEMMALQQALQVRAPTRVPLYRQ